MLPSRVLNPASGIGKYWKTSAKIIRFARHGCANRPFFHIVVMEVKEFLSYMWLGWHDPNSYIASRLAIVSQFVTFFLLQRRKGQQEPVIEQIGTYDPMPNERNEKLISFNFERIRYWIGNGAHLTVPVAELLGKHTFWDFGINRNKPQILQEYLDSIRCTREHIWRHGEIDRLPKNRLKNRQPSKPSKVKVRDEPWLFSFCRFFFV